MSKAVHADNIGASRKEAIYNNCKRWRKTNQVSLMFSRAKARAKIKQIEFNITKLPIE